MRYHYVICDVFTDTKLQGNQLAVFTNASGLTDERMRALALEIGFSETTFVLPTTRKDADARVRIFTPAEEPPFAGHPVLGTAFVLAAPMQRSLLRLETGMGVVPVALQREGARIVFGSMMQPIPTVTPFAEKAALLAAVGVERSLLPVELYDNGARHVFVALGSFAEVAALRPDSAALAEVLGQGLGASCFALEDGRAKTRMFWLDVAIGEDAATGSAAGPLAVHLARHGWVPWGTEIEISQGTEIGRPATLYARAEGGPDVPTSVEVGGSAVIVARGEFAI